MISYGHLAGQDGWAIIADAAEPQADLFFLLSHTHLDTLKWGILRKQKLIVRWRPFYSNLTSRSLAINIIRLHGPGSRERIRLKLNRWVFTGVIRNPLLKTGGLLNARV